jgi:mannitol-1-/sugar-/sorbitol-6-/2-deoxyglucose-6-phosphatase
MITAVIFDMDGLLVDSEPFWRRAHRTMLAKRGIDLSEEDARDLAGKGTSAIIEMWRQQYGAWSAEENQYVANELFKEVAEQLETDGEALPGAEALVKKLFDRGVPLAVASSSPLFLIEIVLRRIGVDRYIPIRHSGVDEKRPKPFPDVYLSAADSLGVSPAQCLVFEDSPSGIEAAKAAGMRCIAVPEPGRDHSLFDQADTVITSLSDFSVDELVNY